MSSKKYGLILSDKSKLKPLTFKASHNVFGNDSDSDDEPRKKLPLLRPSDNINRQAKVTQEKAVKEDPTVYQYDEIYDSMVSKKEEKKAQSKEEKKPQYIEKLLKAANKRKIENERRIERQIQKEREKEGDEFKDKEVFVTSAYKKKLVELSLEEQKEKREEYLESIGDVTKQTDLGGFYRHLYEQKLGSDKTEGVIEKQDTEVRERKKDIDKDKESEKVDISKKRNYRKRRSSADVKKMLSEGEIEDSDDEINRVNLNDIRLSKRSKPNDENIDADSDFSIDESSDEETTKNSTDLVKKLDEKETLKTDSSTKTAQYVNDVNNLDTNIKKNEDNSEEKAVETKIKINIWEKRTVGEVFEQALKRYYERKAARGM